MCNEAARRFALGTLEQGFAELHIPLRFPDSRPNMAAIDSIRITDPSVIVRTARDDAAAAELVQRRWSWPGGAHGKPVYNFRSEGRDFRNSDTAGRCLIPLDGFYEFTDPGTPKQGARARKDKWCFTLASGSTGYGGGFFCVAGLWRTDAAVGEAWTMLTAEPGPDVAPYHHRQIVLLPQSAWADWIAGQVPAQDLIAPPPAGTLQVAPVPR